MSKFTRSFRVRWSDTNALGRVNLAGYLRYAIETAWDWGAANGLGKAESEELGFSWVIHETGINLYRPLLPDQVFDFTIWLVKWRRVRGTRCFELRRQRDGNLIADGVQKVVSLDSKTLRPAVPPQHVMGNFLIEKPRELPYQSIPDFQTQDQAAFAARRVVEWRDLDSLEHVNNAIYADYAEDAVTQAFASLGWSPAHFKARDLVVENRRFQIQYLTPAYWGETLEMAVYLVDLNSTGGTWYLDIVRASENVRITRSVVQWSLARRSSAEAQNLPEDLYEALNQRIAVR